MDDSTELTQKQIDSQNKRLAALREKQETQRQRQKLVSAAFKNIDDGPKSKRVVFNDSSDEDEVPNKKKKSSGKFALFGGSDDEDIDLELQNPDDLINSRLKGKGSERLMKLEATFGNDNRFKLDNDFLEDNEHEEENDATKKIMEKERQMRLLSMVVGRDIRGTQKEALKKSSASVRTFQRFDPENSEHVRWMTETTDAQKAEDSDNDFNDVLTGNAEDETLPVEKPPPAVDHRRFFEMDQSFAAELRSKLLSGKKETFSFLSSTNKAENNDKKKEVEENEEPEETVVSKKKSKTKVALPLTTDKPYFFVDFSKEGNVKLQRFHCNVKNKPKVEEKWKTARKVFDNVSRNLRRHKLRDIAEAEKDSVIQRNKANAASKTFKTKESEKTVTK